MAYSREDEGEVKNKFIACILNSPDCKILVFSWGNAGRQSFILSYDFDITK